MTIQIDMNPDGSFRSPPRPSGSPFAVPFGTRGVQPATNRLIGVAVLVAVLATAGVVAFVAISVALTLVPVAIGAGLVAYALIRYRMWKARASFRGKGMTARF